MPSSKLPPSPGRAWCYLVWLSFQRQARAHFMVWIARGLLGLSLLLIVVFTQAGRWTMAYGQHPRGRGPAYAEFVETVTRTGWLPWSSPDSAVHAMASAGIR